MMKNLAESIQENEKAQAGHVSAPSPLSRRSPSPGASTDAGGTKNFKGASWLKG
jgi:hypothetical protein